MKKNSARRTISILALCALAAVMAGALEKGPKPGEPYALIFGTIYGPDQRPVQGVKIKFRRTDEKTKRERVSDSRGEFALRVSPGPAEYIIWPDLKDREAAEKSAVKITIEKDERRDISLHLTEQKPE
jgi:hypothetical protein